MENLKFHNNPNTAKQDKDSWAFASPVNTRYPLMLQLGGLLSQVTPGHEILNIYSWVYWRNVGKVLAQGNNNTKLA